MESEDNDNGEVTLVVDTEKTEDRMRSIHKHIFQSVGSVAQLKQSNSVGKSGLLLIKSSTQSTT